MIDVYVHTSPSGKQYVGVAGRGWRRRWQDHVRDARKGSKTVFHRAIRKYGPESFTHEILERMSTRAGAARAEQLWIERLGSRVRGYNETVGGDGVHGLSARARASIGDAQRGKRRGPLSAEHRARISATLMGHPQTAATREKLRLAHTGRKLSPEHCAKVAAAGLGRKATEETRAKLRAAWVLRKQRRP